MKKGLKGGLMAAFDNNSDCDSMDSNRNMGDASSLGLQSLESNTFDMGDREAEKDDECKNVIFTNTMAANLSNPTRKST